MHIQHRHVRPARMSLCWGAHSNTEMLLYFQKKQQKRTSRLRQFNQTSVMMTQITEMYWCDVKCCLMKKHTATLTSKLWCNDPDYYSNVILSITHPRGWNTNLKLPISLFTLLCFACFEFDRWIFFITSKASALQVVFILSTACSQSISKTLFVCIKTDESRPDTSHVTCILLNESEPWAAQ